MTPPPSEASCAISLVRRSDERSRERRARRFANPYPRRRESKRRRRQDDDGDQQGNSTTGLGIDKSATSRCVYDALVRATPIADVTIKTSVDRLNLVPA